MTTSSDTDATLAAENAELHQRIAQLEAELAQANQRVRELEPFHTLAENAPDVIAVCDLHGKITYANPATSTIAGFGPEVIGMHLTELYAEDPAYLVQLVAHVVQHNTWTGVLTHKRNDGSTYRGQLSALCIRDETGQPQGIAGIVRDVSTMEQTQAELRQSQALLQNVIDHMPASIFVKDNQRRYLLINAYYERMFDVGREHIIGHTSEELIEYMAAQGSFPTPEARQFVDKIVATWHAEDQHVLSLGQKFEIEETYPINGAMRTYLTLKFPLFDEAGAVSGMGGTSTDITDRIGTEAALRKSEALYRTLIRNFPDGAVILFDHDLRYLVADGTVLEVVGLPAEHLIGKTIYDVLSPAAIEQLEPLYRTVLAGQPIEDEMRVHERTYMYKMVPIKNDADTIIAGMLIAQDITDRKRMQAALEGSLRQSRSVLQGVLDYSPAAIFVKDMQGEVLLINQHCEQLLTQDQATDHDDLIGTRPGEMLHSWHVCDQHVRDTGTPIEMEQVLSVAGQPQTYLCIKFPLFNWQGEVYAIGSIATNMSRRKDAEHALAESEERYRTLVETLPSAVMLTSLDGTIQFCNQQTAALFGFESVYEMRGLPSLGMIATEYLGSDPLMHVQNIIETGNFRNIEYVMRRKNGSVFSAEVNSSVVTDQNGYPAGLIITVSDISERKQTEIALTTAYTYLESLNTSLRRNRDLLRALFDGLEDGLLLLDGEGTVQLVNRAMLDLLGCTTWDLLELNWATVYPRIAPDFPGHLAFNLPSSARAQNTRTARYQSPSGSTHILNIQTIALRRSDQHLEQVILYVSDMTDNFQLQARLMDNERFAASGKLAASVAHEINTPLQSIQTFLDLVRLAPSSDDRQTFLHHAQEETQRVGRIARQLLDLYSPSAAVFGKVALDDLIERLLLLIGKRLRDQRITVARATAADLPPIWGRADELMQVLLNLMINAIDAMPDGGTIQLTTSLLPEAPPRTRITIADEGVGISPDMQARIFEPFVTSKVEGTGLGLSISSQIVQQHGGTISVASTPGAGSTFTIVLPLYTPENEETQ